MSKSLEQQLAERYQAEGIDPLTNAYCIYKDKIYRTCAGMELLAMRSGLLCGKDAVVFGEQIDTVCPKTGATVNVPTSAIATYYRFCMDKVCKFQSDEVQFFEYAHNDQRWHFEKGFMFLAKIARSCALRHAFPDIFAGTISYEEAQCELGFDHNLSNGNVTPKKCTTTNKSSRTVKSDDSAENTVELPKRDREFASKMVASIFQK